MRSSRSIVDLSTTPQYVSSHSTPSWKILDSNDFPRVTKHQPTRDVLMSSAEYLHKPYGRKGSPVYDAWRQRTYLNRSSLYDDT